MATPSNRALAWLLLVAGCAAHRPGLPRSATGGVAVAGRLWPGEEAFLGDPRQLTFGGENAEAYWSFDGAQLSFQARADGEGCDRIYRMPVADPVPVPVPVSSGRGATTCAHFFPTGDLLFSSTHLAGDVCPPRPDSSHGYVWALHEPYDIFRADADGANLRALTRSKGYDAEATVCGRDGSIVFTSVRDGDLELYRMNSDGSGTKRLTRTPGYDGGAFFNRACSKIVWRASRPRVGAELDEYRALLARGLVRPSKLELWMADADGGNAMQLTYLDAASFAPAFHPDGNLIVFSSNHGGSPREFDLWAIRTDGSGLVRVSSAPGFDGFPHFSPDGRLLAFSSNRATAPGRHDTNVFVARWLGGAGRADGATESAADRVVRDIAWLADPAREGRGPATQGLAAAGAWLETRLAAMGLDPAGDAGTFRQSFPIATAVEVAATTRIDLGGAAVARGDFSVPGYSASGRVAASLVLAGYGLRDADVGIDDYAGLDVRGKVVLVRRFAPENGKLSSDAAAKRRLGDIRKKAWTAREQGARALIVVDWPARPDGAALNWQPPPEAPLPPTEPGGPGDAGIPVVVMRRAAATVIMPRLLSRPPAPVTAVVDVALTVTTTPAFNVVGRIPAGHEARAPGSASLVIGAHYDHLGFGGRTSLAPDRREPHPGADDNASGVAAVLEAARALMARRSELSRDVLVALFSGEETGLLGSNHFVRARTPAGRNPPALAMLNFDMVGRMRDNRLDILGSETADEWRLLVEAACAGERVTCNATGDGFGPSDQAAFYAAGIPVLHFFTGAHADYHKPSDTAARVNAAGAAAVARIAKRVLLSLDATPRLTFRAGARTPTQGGDMRSFNASLGTIPDYAGPPDGAPGVLLSGVRPGGGADKAGMKRGDILVRLGVHDIRNVEDLMYALNAARPGDRVTAVVLRDGARVPLDATFQEAPARR